MDLDAREVKRAGQAIELTPKEFDLAVVLFRNVGRLLSRGHLQETVWGRTGDVIDIVAVDGETLARGLSEYDAADAALICGKRSADLEGILGAVPRQVLVHRDQMVLL